MSKKAKVRIALRADAYGAYVALGDDTLCDEDLMSNANVTGLAPEERNSNGNEG